MAKMMRSRSWVKVSNTYGTEYSGSFRGRDQTEEKRLIAEWEEEAEADRQRRELWNFLYSLHPAWFADKILDDRGIPKPPSRARRMP